MKAVAGILFCLAIVHVFADDCGGETRKELGNGVVMICKNGIWRVSRRSRPKGPPCMDDLSPNATCSADRGACLQYTDAGKKADLDCPETCGSCDACRCQDASQWHTYCPFWAQYCSSSGVLGTWMTSNCRKTCGKCKCKCCSYGGQQHQLGARISLPDKCGELICQEFLVAAYSPLLKGAAGHKVSHPEELTLNFRSVHDGADCCILPGNARNANGSSSPNGTMVQEGWKGLLDNHGANVPTTCCHGVLCTPLNGTNQTSSTTTTLTTTTTTTTTSTTTTTTTTPTTTRTTTTASNIPAGDPQCEKSYKTFSDSLRMIEYGVKHQCSRCANCDLGMATGWYRFKFPSAPYAKIPTTAPLKKYVGEDRQSCGTFAVSWMEDTLPAIGDTPKDITINFAWHDNYPKGWSAPAKIVACPAGRETMYLYYLSGSLPRCHLGYCAM